MEINAGQKCCIWVQPDIFVPVTVLIVDDNRVVVKHEQTGLEETIEREDLLPLERLKINADGRIHFQRAMEMIDENNLVKFHSINDWIPMNGQIVVRYKDYWSGVCDYHLGFIEDGKIKLFNVCEYTDNDGWLDYSKHFQWTYYSSIETVEAKPSETPHTVNLVGGIVKDGSTINVGGKIQDRKSVV